MGEGERLDLAGTGLVLILGICLVHRVTILHLRNHVSDEGADEVDLALEFRAVGTVQLVEDVLDVFLLLFLVIEVDVAQQVHDVGDVDTVRLHDVDGEVDVHEDGHLLGVALLYDLVVYREVPALEILVGLLTDFLLDVCPGEVGEGLKGEEDLRHLAECQHELHLVFLGEEMVHVLRSDDDLVEHRHGVLELLQVVVVGLHQDPGEVPAAGEEGKRVVRRLLEVPVADDVAELLRLLLHAVRAGERLKKAVPLQVLVDVKGV